MNRCRTALRPMRGFTLVEVMVAMALLSLVMLVLGSSIRSMGASAERIDARTANMDQMRVATGFLREVVGRVSSQPVEPPATGLLYAGGADGMGWIGVMPARFGPAGRHFFHLGVERLDDASVGLVLRFVPWRWEQKTWPAWAQADSRVLVRDVNAVAFSYGGEGLAQGWLAAWPADEKKLPPRVRMLVTAAGSEWPPLVLAMHALPANASSGGFVVGAP